MELLSFKSSIYKGKCETFKNWRGKKNAINKFKKKKLCCGPLVLAACNVTVEITDIQCGFLSKHLFQWTQHYGSFTKPVGNEICIKNVFHLSHGIKSIHRSKLYQWYIHTWKTQFFCSCCFWKSVRRFFSDRVTNYIVYTLVCASLLCISKEKQTNLILVMGRKLSSLYVGI